MLHKGKDHGKSDYWYYNQTSFVKILTFFSELSTYQIYQPSLVSQKRTQRTSVMMGLRYIFMFLIWAWPLIFIENSKSQVKLTSAKPTLLCQICLSEQISNNFKIIQLLNREIKNIFKCFQIYCLESNSIFNFNTVKCWAQYNIFSLLIRPLLLV